MYYCGPAVHTLFISCTRMAGDDDFIKSGKVGAWLSWGVERAGILNVCTGMQPPLPSKPHEFKYHNMFSARNGSRHEMGNQSRCCS